MNRLILVALCWGSALFGAQSSEPSFKNWAPFSPFIGDTDQYGYYWVDTGLPYNWIDIAGIGTEVTGLGDDNNTGPFDIGFNFPYYWYQATQFWVNSNGAISFSSSQSYTPQQQGFYIPNQVLPNDLLIPLGADLTFDSTQGPNIHAKCYYYTNHLDTLIVSFLNVAAWLSPQPSGSHSFQIILNGADSTIVFQYGNQQGAFYENKNVAGIENTTGLLGLQYFQNAVPESGKIVKFIPPQTTPYEVQDVGILEALSEGSEGIFLLRDQTDTFFVTVKNYGNTAVDSFDVQLIVKDLFAATYFSKTLKSPPLGAGETAYLNFGDWTPTIAKTYIATAKTLFSADMNTFNNKAEVEIVVMTYPWWLMWDSNPSSAEGTSWMGGNGGWGQEFEPPVYPTAIESIAFAVQTNTAVELPVYYMDDDGPGGGPGTILYADTIPIDTSSAFMWHTIPIIPPDTIWDGKFYVGVVRMQTDSFLAMIQDPTIPFSGRSWENTGVWAPYRDRESRDIMIRAWARNDDYGAEEVYPATTFKLLQNTPNPTVGNTAIKFSVNKQTKVSLRIYNLSGQLIRTLIDKEVNPGINSVVWDGKNEKGNPVSAGIYFYELKAGSLKETKKLILLR